MDISLYSAWFYTQSFSDSLWQKGPNSRWPCFALISDTSWFDPRSHIPPYVFFLFSLKILLQIPDLCHPMSLRIFSFFLCRHKMTGPSIRKIINWILFCFVLTTRHNVSCCFNFNLPFAHGWLSSSQKRVCEIHI